MITIVALLTIRDADAFKDFETQAAAIMKFHGGRIDSAFRPAAQGTATSAVDEIHVLKFPDNEAFERYRNDERLLALSTLREQAISETRVYVSAAELGYPA